ncbi:MAG: hypothetical protein LCH39_14240 [Proteobacteria bacterium]|nr:hypothetical protein [Pseudomonadota bacterium]
MSIAAQALDFTIAGSEVRITFEAPVASQHVLIGKTPEEVVRLVGLIHNLCAEAHRAAARTALGLPAQIEAAPAVLVEILREHLMILTRAAPPLLGLELVALPVAFARFAAAFAPGGEALRDALALALFGAPFDAPFSFREVMRHSLLAPLFVALAEREAALKLEAVDIALPSDPSFFPRIAQDPGFDRLAGLGPLLERLLGRLYEVHVILRAMGTPEDARYAPRLTQPGVACVAAARGTLTHRVRLEDGRVAAYAIETPTGAMLGKDGPLAVLLAALSRAPGADEALIRLGLLAFDPCVAHAVSSRPKATRRMADA